MTTFIQSWAELITLIISLCGVCSGILALVRISEVHVTINSRMTTLLKLAREKGMQKGMQEEKGRR